MWVLVVEVGLTLWLGLYLLVRDARSAVARRTAVGLIAYTAALVVWLLAVELPDGAPSNGGDPPDGGSGDGGLPGAELLDGPGGWLLLVLVCVPAVAWTGACVRLLPEQHPHRDRLDLLWRRVAVPLAAVAAPAAAWLGGTAYVVLAVVVLAPLLTVLVIVVRAARGVRPVPAGAVLVVASLFFGLSAALIVLPLDLVPATLLLVSVDLDMLALGVTVAWSSAFDAGEALRRDMARSLLAATGVAVLFGGQVGLAMLAGPGATTPLVALLLGTVAAAVAVQVLAGPAHGLLDRLVFAGSPELTRQRAQLREVAQALPRRDDAARPGGLDDEEFVRLTRRALSGYGDLARLTASPLANLPVIGERLAARGAPDQPLERAAELKALLLESIARLKPRDGEFGTSEEWRYYNALYFPYVVGLRPYRRTVDRRALDPVTRQAYDWFATRVPQRSLHNWQNAAARLVAADLRRASRVQP